MRVPRISYARGADGVSLAFTVAGDGPAVVFVPWVPFSNLLTEWQNPLLNRSSGRWRSGSRWCTMTGGEPAIRSGM